MTSKDHLRLAFLSLAFGVAAIAACSEGGPRGATNGDGGKGDGGLTVAEFGLDARPKNATCIAPQRPPNAAPVKLESVYEDVFSGPDPVTGPMLIAQRPGDGSRWFLAQRDGRIVSFNAGAGARDRRDVVTKAQLEALTGKTVTSADESGFHGMAFDPSFAQNGRLYVAFSTTCDGNVPICDDPNDIEGNDYWVYAEEIGYLTSTDGGATFGSYTRLMHVGRWSQMHYSGTLAFGPDGHLWITSGDGLDDSAAQHTDNWFGKVLRIDVHGSPAPGLPYAIPADNPFADGVDGKPEVVAWGLRNPFRLSFDRETGEAWLGDVGQDSWEEIDKIEIGGNYGWPCREGKAVVPAAVADSFKCPTSTGFIDPLIDHEHQGGGGSVTGGYVYRGTAIPGFQGTYVYGDFIKKELRGLALVGGEWRSTVLNGSGPQDGYVSFAEDDRGEIYSVALFDAKIHKLVATGPVAPSTFPQKLSETGCVLPDDPTKPREGVIPFTVSSPLWSDGAEKERWLAIPDGSRIGVGEDGDFDLPVGTVLMKTFALAGKRVETRLFIRHDDGDWGGYSYEWNDEQTDATLLPSGKVKQVGAQKWAYPSRSECGLCHTGAAGGSLGLEIGQLNRDAIYPSTQRIAPQLATLDHIGLFAAPLGDPKKLLVYPASTSDAPVELRARAYLHANCGGCHRPNSGGGRAPMDLRFATTFAQAKACDERPVVDDFGSDETRILVPGSPALSVMSRRLHATDAKRMPPLGRFLVDEAGAALVDEWIASVRACP